MNMNRWTGFYAEDPRVLSAPRSLCSEYAATKFRKHDCSSILDLGCGVGRDSFYLASQGLNVFSIDSAYTGLVKAQSLVSTGYANKCRLIQGDALALRSLMPVLTEYTVLGCCTSSCLRIAI